MTINNASELQHHGNIITACCVCHSVIDNQDKRLAIKIEDLSKEMQSNISHSYCPDCFAVAISEINKLM
jgi:hypothetical protein